MRQSRSGPEGPLYEARSLRHHHRVPPKNPRARIPGTTFPESYLLTERENKIIDDILELLNEHGLTSHQSLNVLERLGRLSEMGQRLAKDESKRAWEPRREAYCRRVANEGARTRGEELVVFQLTAPSLRMPPERRCTWCDRPLAKADASMCRSTIELRGMRH